MFSYKYDELNSVDVIGSVLENNQDIAELSIFEPNPTLPAQDRILGDAQSQALVSRGLGIRESLGLPFWDAVLVSCLGKGSAAFPILEQARFHNEPPARIVSVPRSKWDASFIAGLLQQTLHHKVLILDSRVRLLNGEYKHIPMLDFHCPPSPANQALAIRVASLIYPSGGYLLQSGKSYHFYGARLITEEHLAGFLGTALLFSPLIDRAWVAHQLIEGKCGLRISTRANGGDMPRAVAKVLAESGT